MPFRPGALDRLVDKGTIDWLLLDSLIDPEREKKMRRCVRSLGRTLRPKGLGEMLLFTGLGRTSEDPKWLFQT